MSYEFLVLHVLKNNESATTPEQITKLLKADMYWFVNGNSVRVTLKRLRDKGLIMRNDNGTFAITTKGLEHYENLSKPILEELSPIEKQLFEFLQIETKGYEEFVAFPLEGIAKKLNIPFKKCLDAAMRLACKRKVLLGFQQRSRAYQISLSFTEYAKLRGGGCKYDAKTRLNVLCSE
jgi:DNA-binding PadR family transcriptional regulator